MTKAVPPSRVLLTKRDGNQEDVYAPEPSNRSSKLYFPLQQQQSPDCDEDAETRDECTPTSLEDLLDLELDLVLPATAITAPTSNQVPASAPLDEKLEVDVDSVSLELLAMQSPHGENQQWQNGGEEEQNVDATSSAAPARPEHSLPRKMKGTAAARKPMPLNIASPTAFIPSFPPLPTQQSTDDDYGLASPMALPDTPSQARLGIAFSWDLEPTSPTIEDVHTRGEAFRCLAQSKSVQKPERRASSASLGGRAATPNPRNCVPTRGTSRITRSSLPALPEFRGKARHGGIYSLLLKNTSVKQEPVLVEDAHNPEEVVAAPSVSKVSPPRTFGKQKHGGIYKMLRDGRGPQ
ncbi:hypothetical protein PC129_g9447 [Phytophthora cactorum]|uniref:Uncharacterized protein n=1 Tax=Phytophthora cactorum TaxID=29920 RepID=A0A329RW54_9STRA|nr:hypothetical protein Pcac1_g25207 [Phytophthora cactorum]KAG2822356.1 hypothetical protein PC111_g10652 [Phytophthora cactorum]KAG2827809.1 hypothetical protein PC112_g8712 [Phytophthora cactorum]KAG2859134.1 hypothetical protein PC113_g9199 [Phytophthora cactorum]KAG2906480.1 hypothetical protein PC114_g11127 [Phytophthora cactorum]